MKVRDDRGFTITELMVVLALGSVILAIAAPSFRDFQRNSRLTSIANDFLGAVQSARSEAITRQTWVSVCPADAPEAATPVCTDTGTDFHGWLVFVDPNHNCKREASATGAAAENIVRVGPLVDKHNVTSDNARKIKANSDGHCLSFAGTGFLEPKAVTTFDPAIHTVFCDGRGLNEQKGSKTAESGADLSAARGILVTTTGRARITRDISTSGSAANITTWNVSCSIP
jgi:prepilin-type N-terminal cleavage/methylation domain-containing protein